MKTKIVRLGKGWYQAYTWKGLSMKCKKENYLTYESVRDCRKNDVVLIPKRGKISLRGEECLPG